MNCHYPTDSVRFGVRVFQPRECLTQRNSAPGHACAMRMQAQAPR
jgi:hypothetical protein